MPESSGNHKIDLNKRLQQVIQRIREAEVRFGRQPGSVQLLPVSKNQSAEDIATLNQAGMLAFGESYVQEAVDKITSLANLGLQWHFIGPIQSNKTQLIAQYFDWVHSIDREKIARRLNDQRPENLAPLNICLQVNISEEASKSGVQPSALTDLAAQVRELPRLRLRGLMAIPAPSSNFEQQRRAFHAVTELLRSLQGGWNNSESELDTLSMGMSGDLEAAIAEGSTIVRVGTDIFGARVLNQG